MLAAISRPSCSERGASMDCNFARSCRRPAAHPCENGMNVRSLVIQSSSVGRSPSTFNGITKSMPRSLAMLSARVRSLSGFGFVSDARESNESIRNVRFLIASSISLGYDSPPSNMKRSHQTR